MECRNWRWPCLFIVLMYGVFVHGDSSFYCHKCDTEQDVPCGVILGSDQYLQLCPLGSDYCTMVWNKAGVIKRGCTNGTFCEQYKIDEETYCCDCQKNGCNWGTKSCNSQAMLFPEWTVILTSLAIFYLLIFY